MSRPLFLIALMLLLIIGGAVLLSGRAREVPVQTIEFDVGGNAGTH